MRLTKRKIDALTFDPDGPSQQIEWDDRLQNFGVRLYKSGAKSFVIRYRNEDGRRRYMTIGKVGRMTIQQARSLALERFVSVDAGDDPVSDARKTAVATIGELIDVFIEKHSKPRRPGSWQEDERRLDTHVKDRWGPRPAQSITRKDLSDLHREIGERARVEANRVVETVRAMYAFAEDEGLVEDGFNPARRVNLFAEKTRDRWLRPDEIAPMGVAIDALKNPYLRSYYWLLLLTATRRTELLEVRWEHVDFERRELFLPDTKNGTDHIVPLSGPAIALFRGIPRQDKNPWVFCSRLKGRHLKDVNTTWRKVRADAGLDDVTLHDFRRTAGSWLAQSGYSLIVIKELLNHTLEGATAIYARMSADAVRDAVEDYAEKVMAAKAGDVTAIFAERRG